MNRSDSNRRWRLAAALVIATLLPAGLARSQRASSGPSAVLTGWFEYIERDQFDSLASLLAPEFVFVSEGSRMGGEPFVAMIRKLGIRHPHVRLSNVVAHDAGRLGYLVYDRAETFELNGMTKTVPETGSMVLVRRGGRWLIAQWTATSPPER